MATLTPSHNPIDTPEFIVASDVMRKFMGMVERVARHCGTVLIMGETGTGKERIAHSIHEHSSRSTQPFVDINCAALPEHLVESELFGYEKGAFSGANSVKPGLFEMAHQGTIFLDEIGELDLKIQVKLLRVLDGAPYYRLGGHRKITADVRVVAATNRNLKEEVSAGRFRKDLYHRLSQFELCVPALRARQEDIVALATHLLSRDGGGLEFSADALLVLQSYTWPGNVRELQNVVNKVMFSATSPRIGAAEVRQELSNSDAEQDAKDHRENGMYADSRPEIRLDNLKAQAIQKALAETGGHRGNAAVQLGISRRTLSRKLRNFGLSSARPASTVVLGSLSDQERLHFRAEIRVPATLVTAEGQELICTTTDLSASGMGFEGLPTALGYRRELRVRFSFPDSDKPVEAAGTLAWADRNRSVGIIFTDVLPETRREMNRWLSNRMAEEGWSVPPVPSEPAED